MLRLQFKHTLKFRKCACSPAYMYIFKTLNEIKYISNANDVDKNIMMLTLI